MTTSFDRIVFSVIGALAMVIGIVIWQSEQLSDDPSDITLINQTQILYSVVDEVGALQLYAIPIDTAEPNFAQNLVQPRQLTQTPVGIWDYAVSPDSTQLIYASLREDGTSALWTVPAKGTDFSEIEPRLLVGCPNATCNGASWSPDGRFLAFTRRNASDFASPATSPPRLWLRESESGETVQIFQDSQILGLQPSWSHDGQWISYISPDPAGVAVYNLEDGRSQFFESSTGQRAAWHPHKNQLLINRLWDGGDRYVVHLFHIDLESGVETDISNIALDEFVDPELVEDSSPIWSPDGEWIVFRRKEMTGPRESLSKQLWVMRTDGSEARALTTNPEIEYGDAYWSPDGEYLLFHRFPLKGPDITLSTWLIDVETGEQVEIAKPAQRPVWIP